MRQRWSFQAAVVLFTIGSTAVNAATVTVYTDKTQWEIAVGRPYRTEDFAGAQLNTGVSFVSTESGHINPAQEYYQDVLASQSQNEPMTTWSFVPQITAFGGNWVLGGPGGSGNSLLVYIADGSLYVGFIPNSYNGGFWGFVSDTPLTSVRLVGGSGTNQQNYTLDNMVYAPVPPAADLDADGDVDGTDFGVFAGCFNGTGNPMTADCLSADLNFDGVVDGLDFGIFSGCFNGAGNPPACS